MKLVRIDDLVPRRTTIELHPQLTVLRGATPEVRARLVQLFGAFRGERDPGCGGVLEISGVHLGLDRPTLDGLRLDPEIDPVLVWAAEVPAPVSGGPSPPPATAPPPGSATATSAATGAPTWVPPVPVAPSAAGDGEAIERQLDRERARLRDVTSRRTELSARMEQVRTGLDSFANAALEVCVGQIDALESRRSLLRAQWERDRAEQAGTRDELVESARRHRAALDAVRTLDLSALRAARDQLEQALRGPIEPDPVANELAVQIDTAWRSLRDLRGRTASAELRRHEAEQRLAEAGAATAEQSMRTRVFDRADVLRLEQVRDEIFAVDDRQSRLAAHRNRRKLQELRDEEAMLLERLGFDTYSSYVMGIPSVRAELERSSRLDAATTRIEQIERELQSLAADAPDPREVRHAEADLERLLAGADDLLGAPVGVDRSAVAAEDRVHETITALRARRVHRAAEADPEVRAAVDQVRRAVLALGPDGARSPDAIDLHAVVVVVAGQAPTPSIPEAPEVAGRRIDEPRWRGGPQELLAGVDEWIVGLEDLSDWVAHERSTLSELEDRLADLDRDDLHRAEVSEWAVVEAELDAALDRLAAAEERVRAHDQAMVQLAELRDTELGLRAEERELLSSVARLEQVRREHPLGTGDERSGIPPTSRLPPAYRPPTAAATSTESADQLPEQDPSAVAAHQDWSSAEAAEWAVIRRLAEQRAVSFVGSVPLLLDGLPADSAVRATVCDRLRRMADLVQVVVLSDDAEVVRWAEGLGASGAVRTI